MARIGLQVPICLDTDPDEQVEHYYRYECVADCNDQAARLFGLPRAEAMIGARFETVSPRSNPETLEVERGAVEERPEWLDGAAEVYSRASVAGTVPA
ncbi:MAG: PAS domain-containing protein, partial [Acidobacteria bacterium]|nr:PAS domain-containing protein [Acidobacteriota bacterium]